MSGEAHAIADMTARDLDAVERIARGTFRPPWTRAALEAELSRAISRCRVIRDRDGSVIAYAISWIVGPEQELLAIATDPAHRRRGLGGRLLRDLLEEGHARGAHECFLEVRPSNVPAITLYGAHGFEVLDVRTRYYEDGEDAWIMARRTPR